MLRLEAQKPCAQCPQQTQSSIGATAPLRDSVLARPMAKVAQQVRDKLPGEAGSWEKENSPGKNRLNRKSLWLVKGEVQQRFVVVCNYQQREKVADTGRCFHPADKSLMNPMAGG